MLTPADHWVRFPTHAGWWWVWDSLLKLEPEKFYIEELGQEADGRPFLKAQGYEKRYHPNDEVTYCEVRHD